MKAYYVMTNVGKCRYLLNYHNGQKTHKDGSPFYDVALFSNQKKLNQAVKQLTANGYKERSVL